MWMSPLTIFDIPSTSRLAAKKTFPMIGDEEQRGREEKSSRLPKRYVERWIRGE